MRVRPWICISTMAVCTALVASASSFAGETCPPGTVDEGEICGSDANGGCNSVPTVYGVMKCGETVCGSYWADASFRDTDWYKFTVTNDTNFVTLDVTSSFSIVLGFLDTNCPPFIFVLELQSSPASVSFCLPAGEFVAFVAPGDFFGLPCGGGNNQYLATLTCGDACEVLACGSASAGDCCSSHGTPFCSDNDCCNAVCAFDSFCCAVQWDSICASEAAQACCLCGAGSCDTTCPEGGQAEAEACGDDTNGGCNPPINGSTCCFASFGLGCDDVDCTNTVCAADSFCCAVAWDSICASEALALCGDLCAFTPAYEPITPGVPKCGSFWADGSFRDTDWYSFSLSENTLCTLTVYANFPVALGFLDNNCPPFLYIFQGQNTCPDEVSFCLPAGTFTAFVAPNGFNGLPCGSVACGSDLNAYVATLTTNGPCTPLGCGSAEAGDCCAPHANPYCSDEACCQTVCSFDSFCCSVQWDGICSSEAASSCNGLCASVCGTSANDCFSASPDGTPGCNDAACCTTVCAADPFCCQVAWDGICAGEASSLCVTNPVKNDECVDATTIFAGITPFSTIGATTSAPGLDPTCEKGFGLALVNDIWFTYVATANGTVTVSTCNDATYDTRMAAYAACGDVNVIACNDDGPGCAGFTSLMTFDTTCNTKYLLRIGGFGGSGTGNITITQTGTCPVACPGDLNGDGVVDATDLGILLGGWGGPGISDINGDGTTNAVDLGILLGAWGPCP